MECMPIDTACGQCLVAESNAVTATDGLCNARLRNIPNCQVQDMFHAVIFIDVFLNFLVLVWFLIDMSAP